MMEKDVVEALKKCPLQGEIFRHYKGGVYEVVGCSMLEDGLEPLVLYRRKTDYGATTWARKLSSWAEIVKIPAQRVPRFTKIG